MKVLKNIEIGIVSLNVFKLCSNYECTNMVELTGGGNICRLCNVWCQDAEERLHQKVGRKD